MTKYLFIGDFPICFWKRFGLVFDQTALGKQLLHHLGNEEAQYIHFYLRDCIYIKFFPHDHDKNQYMVSDN